MLVTKRNKKAQIFDIRKIENTIRNTFRATDRQVSDEQVEQLAKSIVLQNGITTNSIQTQLENLLMKEGWFDEARMLIIYRHINYHSKSMRDKVKFMRSYLGASNAASGSKYDANANVTETNLVTLSSELFKGDTIKFNRYRMYNKILELYGEDLAKEYLRQLESHELYKHDESSILPYCVAISMYPYLLSGLEELGGISTPPHNIDSFCGSFVNLVFAVSAHFAGACATGEFLMYFDYFARIDFGQNYREIDNQFYTIGPKFRKLLNETGKWFKDIDSLKDYDFGSQELNIIRDELVYNIERPLTDDELNEWLENVKKGNYEPVKYKMGDGTRTVHSMLTQYFQQIVYSLNQPAAARSYQSIFWNISYFDKYYFEGLFKDFYFPDGTQPVWESLSWLQKKFMKWFNNERTKCILTFPVETVAMLTDGEDLKDEEWAEFVSEMYSEGHSFFTYLSDNPDSLSSCCRLRNEVTDNTFSYSLGAGGIATGSKSVMTLNLNRLVQDAIRKNINYIEYLRDQIRKVHKYQTAYNELLKECKEQGALQVYDAGFIDMKKQYLTIGVNGFVEAAEFLGIPIKPCPEYRDFCDSILKVFNEENKAAKTKELMFNTEFVPAENLGVKHAKWDKEAGYEVPRECYNSYFYKVEDDSLSILDKFKLHGKDFVQYLDGGSALHLNLEEHLSKDQYRQLLRVATKCGTNYFTYNIPNSICNTCGHIDKRYLKECPHCHSKDIDYATRIIGYLKRISNFSEPRQKEAKKRFYLGKPTDNLTLNE